MTSIDINVLFCVQFRIALRSARFMYIICANSCTACEHATHVYDLLGRKAPLLKIPCWNSAHEFQIRLRFMDFYLTEYIVGADPGFLRGLGSNPQG